MLIPAPTLQPFAALEQEQIYLSGVVPWRDGAYVNLHWSTSKMKPDGKTPYWSGRACSTLDEALSTLKWVRGLTDTRDLYVCMSAQSECEEKVARSGRTYRRAVKGTKTAVGAKSLWLDLDVKEGAYADTREAILALKAFTEAVGLPRPTMCVASGSGGMHVYWTMNRVLSREEWQPLANALVEATRRHDLKCDTQCTVDIARVLRIPGTLNWKSDPPKPVTLGVKSVQPGDYEVELIQKTLAPYMGATVINFIQAGQRAAAIPCLNDEFTGDIAEAIRRPPVDLDSVADSCGFVREAITTGGQAFTNPLWNLTTLIATFGMGGDGKDGRAQAHRMASGHKEAVSLEVV